MVSTYLVHHGYCSTAEAFASSTGQVFEEDLNSIKNRQSEYYSFISLFISTHFELRITNEVKFYGLKIGEDSNCNVFGKNAKFLGR